MNDLKICVMCKHFKLDMGDSGYSDLTPGYDAEIGCWYGIWDMQQSDGVNDYRNYIQLAKTCTKFEPVETPN